MNTKTETTETTETIIECYRCQEDEGDFVHVACGDCRAVHRLCLFCAKAQKEDIFELCYDCELEHRAASEAPEPHCICRGDLCRC